MASLSRENRFVIGWDAGSDHGSEVVYQSELPETIRRLSQCNCRIHDVQSFPSEWDEEMQYQKWVAANEVPEQERPF